MEGMRCLLDKKMLSRRRWRRGGKAQRKRGRGIRWGRVYAVSRGFWRGEEKEGAVRRAWKGSMAEKKQHRLELRTDLALEEKERFKGDGGEVKGVSLREWQEADKDIQITEVKILNEQGAKAMGKEKGTYLTIEARGLEEKGEAFQEILAGKVAKQLQKLINGLMEGGEKKDKRWKVLVVGLGNLYVTPDSLGPRVLQNLPMTRHYDEQYGKGFLKEHHMGSISGIAPGVMAQTGMETAEILKGVVKETKPELVIAIDALAARSVRRLGCTIQLTDTGIRPGSGVGNHRNGLTQDSLGVPVLAVGVPTVVGAAAIVQDTIGAMVKVLEQGSSTKGAGLYLEGLGPDEQYALIRELLEPEFGPMFVTPPDIEERVDLLGRVISQAIRRALIGNEDSAKNGSGKAFSA